MWWRLPPPVGSAAALAFILPHPKKTRQSQIKKLSDCCLCFSLNFQGQTGMASLFHVRVHTPGGVGQGREAAWLAAELWSWSEGFTQTL